MEILPMTMGQFDLLHGTYSGRARDEYLLHLVVDSPRRISLKELACARDELVYSEEALRCMAHPSLQYSIMTPLSISPEKICTVLLRELSSDEDMELQEAVNSAVKEFSTSVELTKMPLSSIYLINSPKMTRLIFIFHHFLADYFSMTQYVLRVISTLEGRKLSRSLSSYRDFVYLHGVGQEPASSPRDVAVEPLLGDRNCVEGVDLGEPYMSEFDVWARSSDRVSPVKIVKALDEALRESFTVERVRIDVSEIGRRNSAARRAGGWLAHAVPLVSSGGEYTAELFSANIASWPVDFLATRSALGVGQPENYRAHAFMNFFGSASVRNRKFSKYSVSRIQPSNVIWQRRSETPFHFKISKVSDCVRVNLKYAYKRPEALYVEALMEAFLSHAKMTPLK